MSKIYILEVPFSFGDKKDSIFPVILEGENENEMILVDCGYPNFLNLIESIAISNGININKLSKIIITHHDFDHMGALAEFKRKYPNIQVLSYLEDASYIDGSKKSLRLQQAESIYDSLAEEEKEQAKYFHKTLESVEPCNVDVTLKDKDYLDVCGGVEVIATPGHMPTHISIYHKESKSLITGDALVIENDELVIALPQYTLDIEEAKRSIKKFLNYDIEKVVCYHGGIYEKDIKESFKRI